MNLPFDPKRSRAYEIEWGAGGQRLGCKFLLDDGSLRSSANRRSRRKSKCLWLVLDHLHKDCGEALFDRDQGDYRLEIVGTCGGAIGKSGRVLALALYPNVMHEGTYCMSTEPL